jgi:membrane-anchored protein YejM (alkaline phosphatase superfamily)
MVAPESFSSPTRGLLVRWIGWFGIVNALLFAFVGLRYLFAYGMPGSGIAVLYVALAFIAQFALLGFMPMMLMLAPAALLLPRKGIVLTLGVLLAACGLTLLVLDTNIFAEYRYHLSLLTVEIFETSTWVFAGIIFAVALLFQSILAANVWQRVAISKGRKGVWLGLMLVFIWLGGQGIHIWGDATAYAPVTGFTRYMPMYFPMKSKRRLAKLGWIDPEKVEQQRLLRRASAPDPGQLRYPLNPLSCDAQKELPNILFVLVDALRPDHIGEELTPRIATFAANSQNFSNHYSGGNSSRMGLFSMFYGLPSTYWQTFYDLQRPPVLMDQMQVNDYEFAAFSAVGFGSPAQIDRTVFAAVGPDDRYAASAERDRNGEITKAWQAWIADREDTARPFFSMLYYDPGKSPVNEGVQSPAKSDVEGRHAAYRRSITAVDQEVAQLLDNADLQQQERETLVIIASDHGYEFDELGLGNIGHGSNYGPWQLRSVLLMNWPGKEPRLFDYRSAHQDLPGTLLKDVFGCENPYADYSSGGNLFDEQPWQWIVAGSYSSYAIIEQDKIVVTYPGGLIELLDADYRPAPDLQLDPQRIEEAMLEMRRFYK